MSKLKDLKEGLSSARKADLTHVRTPFMVYTARPCEYGSVKYQRANFMRRVSEGAQPTKADFERLRSYLRAAASHIFQVLDSMEAHQAGDPDVLDVEGMKRAAYAVDTDETPGAKVGPSLLPHIAPACASLMMAVTQATGCGLLPADPGQPWSAPADTLEKKPKTEFVIQSDPRLPYYGQKITAETARAMAAIPKEASQFAGATAQLTEEAKAEFAKAHPDWPNGVNL